MAVLRKGTSGEPVKRLQAKLGVEADGEFGSNTEKALKEWQAKYKNSLTPDGIAGPDTFMAMGLYELVLLKEGTRGDAVKTLQEKLGVAADGQFGPGTEKAVRDYQQKNGLVADDVEQRSDVSLDEKEEELLGGNLVDGEANHGVFRIGPHSGADQVRVPRNGGCDCDGDDECDPREVQPREEWSGGDAQHRRQRDSEFHMPVAG